jgi:hypothetical protein
MDLLSRFPNGAPTERDTSLQSLLQPIPWKLSFPQSSIIWAPSRFPYRVPMERDTLSLSIHLYLPESPKEGALLQNGENIRSLSMEPHVDRRPTYSWVRPCSPRGSLMTLLSLPQCHAPLGTIPSTLAWVDQSPVRQHVLYSPQQGIPWHLSPPPTWARVDYDYNSLRYVWVVGFIGGLPLCDLAVPYILAVGHDEDVHASDLTGIHGFLRFC